jgi:hypothetical protein
MKRVGALAVALSLCSCRSGVTPATFEARTLRPSVRESSARATYFPPATPRARRHGVPVLVVEPVLFRRELLTAGPSGGLVGYLESEGFSVWLVWSAAPDAPSAAAFARDVVLAAQAIAQETGANQVDIVGVSFGAEAALRALEPLTSPDAPVTARRVAFLGGGFDFAYPHSFAARTANVRGGPASALCSLDGDRGCAHEFHQAPEAVPWLGALPPSEDALAPARERFAFARRFSRLPVLFVNGKADGIAPSESMFPLYTLWGSDEPNPRNIPKLLFLAGRENGLAHELDHFDLFAGDQVTDVWSHVARWLERSD